MRDGRVKTYRGNYSEYREALLAEEEARRSEPKRAAPAPPREPEKKKAAPRPAKKEKKPRKPRNPWRLEKIEKAIIALESEREEIMASLATEEVYRNADAMREAQFRLAEVERDLDEKNQEWESFA